MQIEFLSMNRYLENNLILMFLYLLVPCHYMSSLKTQNMIRDIKNYIL